MKEKITKVQIKAELTEHGIPFRAKATKGELEAMLKAAQKPKARRPGLADAKRLAKDKGVKAGLYAMFSEIPGLALTQAELEAIFPDRKWSSIVTWVGGGGLGSEKYGMVIDGKVQTLLIEKGDDDRYRAVDD